MMLALLLALACRVNVPPVEEGELDTSTPGGEPHLAGVEGFPFPVEESPPEIQEALFSCAGGETITTTSLPITEGALVQTFLRFTWGGSSWWGDYQAGTFSLNPSTGEVVLSCSWDGNTDWEEGWIDAIRVVWVEQ